MARGFNGTSDFALALASQAAVDNWSVAGWVNYTGGTPAIRFCLFQNGQTLDGYGFSIEQTTGNVSLYLGGVNRLDSLYKPTAGTWFHVAGVRNAGTSRIYINGALAAAGGTMTDTPNAPSAWCSFGAFTDVSKSPEAATYAACQLAEVAVWSAPLVVEELLALAARRQTRRVRTASLAFYWPLFGLQSPEPGLAGVGAFASLTGTTFAPHAPVALFTRRAVNLQVILPQAPTNLAATAGLISVALSWSSTTPAPVTYSIYRSTFPGAETLLDNGVAATSYTDGAVSLGVTYYYKVSATDPGGEGALSAEASVALATIPAPTSLTATGQLSQVILIWSAVVGATSYDVLRSLTPGGETLLINVHGTSYADTAVTTGVIGVTYYYKVRALIEAAEGTAVGILSTEASATLQLPLQHSPADILRWLLVGLNQLGDPTPTLTPQPSWPGYVAVEPSTPDNCVTLYDTAGVDDARSMIDGELWQHYGIQVRIRSVDHKTGWVKAQALRAYLAQSIKFNTVVVDSILYIVYNAARINTVLRIGLDDPNTRRSIFTINLLLTLRPVGN